MAAQHVAQVEGPCQTTGDANGDSVEEVLAKHYAYSFKNLQVMRVESTSLIYEITDYFKLTGTSTVINKYATGSRTISGNSYAIFNDNGQNYGSAPWALEHILSQMCYDKSIISQIHPAAKLQIGVGCSCSSKDSKLPDNPNYLCYIVVARDVVAKDVRERIPEDQSFLKGQ